LEHLQHLHYMYVFSRRTWLGIELVLVEVRSVNQAGN